MSALEQLLNKGLTVEAEGNRLLVAPSEKLDDALRNYIREHKTELLEELQHGKIVSFPDGKALSEQQVVEWLDDIGETDTQARSEWLERCRTDPEIQSCTARLIKDHWHLTSMNSPRDKESDF